MEPRLLVFLFSISAKHTFWSDKRLAGLEALRFCVRRVLMQMCGLFLFWCLAEQVLGLHQCLRQDARICGRPLSSSPVLLMVWCTLLGHSSVFSLLVQASLVNCELLSR